MINFTYFIFTIIGLKLNKKEIYRLQPVDDYKDVIIYLNIFVYILSSYGRDIFHLSKEN